ncbi:hypothetical protein DESUT3_23890 [Desulfuromonas versatilis]|uniref:Preprotein translocase subunit SecA n=1 Tax=Desulfuromonas versatilis TaxID=2802975 RepID=A0ABN6DZ50_9BACT|nr:SEC-C metal-binding domain-containing protein [Desulfuromonas versatilis]BCR05320.1 hypothetical protein DESUT3_23890 [Desulfuromonas versatilis]
MTDNPSSTEPPSPDELWFKALTLKNGGNAEEARKVVEALRQRIENTASQIKDLILAQTPQSLLGFLWGGLLIGVIKQQKAEEVDRPEHNPENLQVALEYVHAVLSCFVGHPEGKNVLEEEAAKEIVRLSEDLRKSTMFYCMATTEYRGGGEFGEETGHVEFTAKTTWVLIRGHRYQVLEEEFFNYMLAPHNEALLSVYGNGAAEIASGVQDIANSMRDGFEHAYKELDRQREIACEQLLESEAPSAEEAIEAYRKDNPELMTKGYAAIQDLFFGGICNLSKHTQLPEPLLQDLAYERGTNTEFFEPGPLCGTLLRTLPARIKPLVKLDDGYYAPDAQFIRDAAYRAIQRGLLARMPGYKEEWNRRQKALTEGAFADIFRGQLSGAEILTEVYYQDPTTGKWVENDTLILLDDVLLQVEVKAGLGAMHSPATNFKNHVRAIQNLVVNAYRQTRRFLEYLNSAAEVPLFELRNGEYIEVRRIRLSDYRFVVPIGLTVESFSPFAAMCKVLPEVEPILGKQPFISMSIDDLFVLNRFLPTTGELLHYLEVRQVVAGIKQVKLFDEFDHLGAYIQKNRFDFTIQEQLAEGMDGLTWDGFSAEVDRYFEGDRWQNEPPPSQPYPDEVKTLLAALAETRAPGWIKADSSIRNLDMDTREKIAEGINTLAPTLRQHPHRYFALDVDPALLLYMCRDNQPDFNGGIRQAEIVSLSLNQPSVMVICFSYRPDGEINKAQGFTVKRPPMIRADYTELLAKAESMKARIVKNVPASGIVKQAVGGKKIRPNDKCFCGSGRKYKKCHGRK